MMSQYQRPQRAAGADKNHLIVPNAFNLYGAGLTKCNEFGVRRGYVKGFQAELHDMKNGTGEIVDWMIVIQGEVIFIEVKVPRVVVDASRQKHTDEEFYMKELTEGERNFFNETTAIRRICTTESEVWDFVLEVARYIEKRDNLLCEEFETLLVQPNYKVSKW